jgi:hypothetical protein
MNQKQYEDIEKALGEAGAGSPKGRLFHHCFGEGDHLMVFDIFEDQASFEAFGEKLMPVLKKMGVETGTPDVMPMVKTIVDG